MSGIRSKLRAALRNITRFFDGQNNNAGDNSVERTRKMIDHKIDGWSKNINKIDKEEEEKKKNKKRRRRLWFITILLIGGAAYLTVDYVKSHSSSIPSLEAKENVIEEITKDSTSTTVKEQPVQPASIQKKATKRKEVNKTTPDGEVLIEKPQYPERGFQSVEEAEEFQRQLHKYKEQQKRIKEEMEKGNSVFIIYKDQREDLVENERFII